MLRRKRKIGKDALAAGRRRAGEELGAPIADDRARLNGQSHGPNPDQNNDSCDDRDRHCRVHGDAELAVVGIVAGRMEVGHLNHDQQRHQGQTQQSRQPGSARLQAAILPAIWLESCQSTIPNFKDT